MKGYLFKIKKTKVTSIFFFFKCYHKSRHYYYRIEHLEELIEFVYTC
jgi:hypothetical protein